MTEQQKKNEDRKKSSMIMTLANEPPFSFENRKVQKKTKEQRQEFIFQAKPIPWFCSVDLLNRKKQEEIVRKERIAKTTQDKLKRAKHPQECRKISCKRKQRKRCLPTARFVRLKAWSRSKTPQISTKFTNNLNKLCKESGKKTNRLRSSSLSLHQQSKITFQS